MEGNLIENSRRHQQSTSYSTAFQRKTILHVSPLQSLLGCLSVGSLPLLCSLHTHSLKAQSLLCLLFPSKKSQQQPLLIVQISQFCHSFYPSEILMKYILNEASMSLQDIFSYQLLKKKKKMVCAHIMVGLC